MLARLYASARVGLRQVGGTGLGMAAKAGQDTAETRTRAASVSLLSAGSMALLATGAMAVITVATTVTSRAHASSSSSGDDDPTSSGHREGDSSLGTIPVDKLACRRRCPPDRRGRTVDGYQPVILVACGSFNPPTVAHLEVLSMVRSYYRSRGVDVVGAYLSPVHDAYGKAGLVASRHRVAMCRLAAEGSDFVMVDDWEAGRAGYTRTLRVLDSVDARVRGAMNNDDDGVVPARSVLVCGADVLASMGTPGVWDQALLEALLERHGVACVVREGTDVRAVCGDAGTSVGRWWRRGRVDVVGVGDGVKDASGMGGVSSSGVRALLRAGKAVEGLVDKNVLAYIEEHGLYVDVDDDDTSTSDE